MSDEVVFSLNGKAVMASVAPSTPLLYVLRNDFELNGPKYGCGLGECGACSVLIDSKIARSCVVPVSAVNGRKVETLEGLGSKARPSVVQQAFIDEQAAQCGYCMNGMIVTATAFLHRCSEVPSETQIKAALRANLCRCGTHVEIVKAVQSAAKTMFATERDEFSACSAESQLESELLSHCLAQQSDGLTQARKPQSNSSQASPSQLNPSQQGMLFSPIAAQQELNKE